MNHRLSIGIDLGTTHSALAWLGLDEAAPHSQVVELPQLVARGTLERRPLLPSMLYFAHAEEGALELPWDATRNYAVGEYCRARAVEAPNRVVTSAKSWLSHASIDRRSAALPVGAPPDLEKISPLEASRRILQHIVEAARYAGTLPGQNWDEFDVVLTVPASFDPAARELTTEAARAAGINNLTLLEEPQAALYAWIEASGDDWRVHLKPGDVVLVVDIGGGTTDFSAIAAVERAGSLELVRVAVGEHILLGGDNMDLALSHLVRTSLGDAGKALDALQVAGLTHACRAAKERLLADNALDAVPIVIASRGAKLLGGSIRTELTRQQVEQVVVEGFVPLVDLSARPQVRPAAGLRQMGLPYASDAAVTRHLAAFLGRQAGALLELGIQPAGSTNSLLRPTKLLFNGGVLKAPVVRQRILDCINGWLLADGGQPASVLPEVDPETAVAKGAAYYGRVRSGTGLRIRGGTARAYYIGMESAMPAIPGVEPPIVALCVAPFGMEEGAEARSLPQELMLVVGEPVRFRFFGSSVRRQDEVGVELEDFSAEELSELAPIEVTLPVLGRTAGDLVAVKLRASVTEVGTLLVEAVPLAPLNASESWKVELGVRGQ
jgi:molecular chaperone DnaK (HSP70)